MGARAELFLKGSSSRAVFKVAQTGFNNLEGTCY